ncbi:MULTISPECIES: mitochondrial fission ELM1 family protein [Microbulbifer]|uniref:mitochondrial fission ELM1 family protein n=1 Tax=Microbulbifer TaxID=48073 RepID=UPI001E2E5356|nr:MULTISPECIES: ELM1/GtrOC1 family putative glycosyltransferase [Microbulbifer]UHQ56935.1 mitochondrial fission ELM1 family protein [Microbulbifer sp. YPW16]
MRLTVWRFLDGNRAHEKQSAALVSGLRDCAGDAVDCHEIGAVGVFSLLRHGLPAHLAELPQPDLIIGAGHRSHLPMLMARRRFGGQVVVIMRPSLPLRWFDFAIIPEHDRPPPLANVILSQGALTEPLPGDQVRPGRGLILLGGPSKHFAWDAGGVQATVEQLLQAPLQWVISDSRRTPDGTLEGLAGSGAELCHWRDCPPGWLVEQLAQAERIWVTGDSVSMLFEALQSQAQVGVIPLPSRRRANKVRAAVQRLLDQGLVTDCTADAGQPIENARPPLGQQVTCARALLRRRSHPID